MTRQLPGILACAVLIATSSCVAESTVAADASTSHPNIVLIMPVDMGWGDIAAHGNPLSKTPNFDRLYGESVRFTDLHVSPACAPTRSALMTGRHEFTNGVTHTILERERMSLNATTLAQLRKSAGYRTGIVGKWHLGDEDAVGPQMNPFKKAYWRQFGGGPDQALRKRMDPEASDADKPKADKNSKQDTGDAQQNKSAA